MGNNEIPWRMVIVGTLYFFMIVGLGLEAYNLGLPDWLRFIIDGTILLLIIGGMIFFVVRVWFKLSSNSVMNSMTILANGIEEPESIVIDSVHGYPMPLDPATLLRAIQGLSKSFQADALVTISKYLSTIRSPLTGAQSEKLLDLFAEEQERRKTDFAGWTKNEVDAFNDQVASLLPFKDKFGNKLYLTMINFEGSESWADNRPATRGRRLIISERNLFEECHFRQTFQYVLGGYPRRTKWAPVSMAYVDKIKNQVKRTTARLSIFGQGWIEENQDIEIYMITGSTQISIDKMNNYTQAFAKEKGVPQPQQMDVLEKLIRVNDSYELETQLVQERKRADALEEANETELENFLDIKDLRKPRKGFELKWPFVILGIAVLGFLAVLAYVLHL